MHLLGRLPRRSLGRCRNPEAHLGVERRSPSPRTSGEALIGAECWTETCRYLSIEEEGDWPSSARLLLTWRTPRPRSGREEVFHVGDLGGLIGLDLLGQSHGVGVLAVLLLGLGHPDSTGVADVRQ